MLVVTFPDPMALVTTVKMALQINPKLRVVARVHRAREADLLKAMGVAELVNPEYEASLQFLRRVLAASGWGEADFKQILPMVEKNREFVEFSPDDKEI